MAAGKSICVAIQIVVIMFILETSYAATDGEARQDRPYTRSPLTACTCRDKGRHKSEAKKVENTDEQFQGNKHDETMECRHTKDIRKCKLEGIFSVLLVLVLMFGMFLTVITLKKAAKSKEESKLTPSGNYVSQDVASNEKKETDKVEGKTSSVAEQKEDKSKDELKLDSRGSTVSQDVAVNEETVTEELEGQILSVANQKEENEDLEAADANGEERPDEFAYGVNLAGFNDLVQKFGILDDKCRVEMLRLWGIKEKVEGNTHFRGDLKKAVEEFLGENFDDDFTSYKKFCRQVVKRVPEDKWMRFVRLHLNLEEGEIQKFKRRFATLSHEQARKLGKTIREDVMNPAMTGGKLLIDRDTAEYFI